jgi:chorismate synthase
MKESQQVRREQFRRETIGAFGGQQQSRRQFNIQQPEQTFQARTSLFSQDQLNRARFGEDVRRGKLNEYSGLVSGFGRYPTATTATQQNVMAPIANIMGIGSGAPERHQQLVNQQAMDAWKLENAEANQARANLGGVVGGIFGTAAGAVR